MCRFFIVMQKQFLKAVLLCGCVACAPPVMGQEVVTIYGKRPDNVEPVRRCERCGGITCPGICKAGPDVPALDDGKPDQGDGDDVGGGGGRDLKSTFLIRLQNL